MEVQEDEKGERLDKGRRRERKLDMNEAILSENAITILKARYLLPGETPTGMFRRVARFVAQAEKEDEKEKWEGAFYELMSSLRFLPNSPTLFNAGTSQGTLSACFVLPIEDSMESIMDTARLSAMIQKFGGGLGYSFSKLRERGSPIKTTQGKACGPVEVLKMYSSLSDMITQGGKRHGANMGILDISHPDILEFLHMKNSEEEQVAQNFNTSVAVTDRFMEAVEEDANWHLVSPKGEEVVKTVKAREIWREIIASAWRTGDPGLYFIDEVERHNPTPHLGELESTNPCGEVPLLAYEACNLGSLNLVKYVEEEGPFGRELGRGFDWERLEEDAKIAVRFLDDVITMNEFPDERIKLVVESTRKVGLGVMGWHDALIELRIPYESKEAIKLGKEVMERINFSADDASLELGVERGTYPGISRVGMVWQGRNATRTCIAPTGTISAIAGVSSGIEPIFALAFVKNVLDGKKLVEVNEHLEQLGLNEGELKEVGETGSCQNIKGLSQGQKNLFKVANEISTSAHIAMQAVFQSHTGLAVSKTINMRNESTLEEVEIAYKLAWKSKCKGITIYRDGSKGTQVLEILGKKEEGGEKVGVVVVKKERPRRLKGFTEKVKTGHGNAYVTVNFDEDGSPFEVFPNMGKDGSCDSAYNQAMGRLISLCFRSGIPVSEVVEQLSGITCHPVWDRGIQIGSSPDAIAHVLGNHLVDEGVEKKRMKRGRCVECGGMLVHQEGCVRCLSCSWTECS